MAMTGTFVLTFARDALAALAEATQLGTAALGLLFRYLTRPPRPGITRDELAAGYGVTLGALRRDNSELAEAGYLMQARRPIGKGRWQHLIIATSTPGELPAEHEAWTLLDASLAAEQANTSPSGADVVTCDDPPAPQVATRDQKRHIKPVNPFASDAETEPCRPLVSTTEELRDLARLPPLPAPEEQGDLWLTPAQVLGLAEQYPPRHLDLALGVLARAGLQWYLAPRVMALLIAGYDTGQLARTLAGVHEGDHPAACARWRLDRLLLTPDPEPNRTPASTTLAPPVWRAPSTTITLPPAPSSTTPTVDVDQELAEARAKFAEIRARAKIRASIR